ncbi:MAG TPA: RHS repeat-associated core domain-containing protein [Casimicrobiaceae bacterium]|nr:RHS repeat-associated core domain-containing protein [Casimicrobiaceae bacterium]
MRRSIMRGLGKWLQFLALAIASASALPAMAAPCAGFTDVDDTSPFCANIAWLKNRGITLGCGPNVYCPSGVVSREQMAAFMNRFGTTFTALQLRVDLASGPIDIDANPVVCQTSDVAAASFARIAFVDLAFSGNATADVGLAADLVMSLDAGSTWTDLHAAPNRGFVRANQWGTFTDLGFTDLDVAQSARWGVRVSRGGIAGGTDLAASRCQLRVRIAPARVNLAPSVNAGANQAITLPANAILAGSASDDGLPNPPGAISVVWSVFSGPGPVTFGNANAATTTATFSVAGGYVLRLTASDGALSATGDVTITVNSGTLPPDPRTVASAIDPTVTTSVFASTAFLYTGTNPIQTGVAPGTIVVQRAAVIRGKVLERNGSALPGVTITILNQPQFGQTLSRADGAFDLGVNGGGLLTVRYQKSGFLPVDRQLDVPWQNYARVPDVVMIPLDSAVTTITMNAAAMQVARGNAMNDADGTRRATLLIPQGTTANLVLPNGTTQPISSLNVRATEYTVGASGPQAMPAPLPPTSGYTYAVELSADEAIAAGATSVVFSQPIASYTENFLRLPVGIAVPAAFYDRVKAAWIPSENGRVIKITAISGGLATVDSVGAGTLPPLVLGNAELARLATLYGVGQELWRVPVTHFTPGDYNLPFRPPGDAVGPQVSSVSGDDELDKCVVDEVGGSIIECQNQVLGERVGLVGTPFTLNYRSARAPGRNAARILRIPLSGASVPASLKRIELDVQVAGRSFPQTFAAAPNQQTSFTWDGIDAYGRTLQGAQPAAISIGYVYDGVYTTPANSSVSFAAFGGASLSANVTRSEITVSQSLQATIGPLDARGFGLGGWSLSAHHSYDPQARVVHLGNGGRRGADSLGSALITTVVGNGNSGFGGDGGPATQALLRGTTGVAVGPDGSLYLTDDGNNRIRRVGPNGVITTVAGNGVAGFSGDGGPAVNASLRSPAGVALAPDGSLYIADNNRIRRVGLDGIINTVAGNGVLGFSGDGGPAPQASLRNPSGVAVGPDGSLYFSDEDNNRIRRVGLDGIISTVAGNGVTGFSGDGGLATQASLGGDPDGIAVGPDGSLYITDDNNKRIRRVGPDGIITTVAGNGVSGFSGDGGLATLASIGDPDGVTVGPDGSVYIADDDNNRIRRVAPGGIITTLAGNGSSGFAGDGGPAARASIRNPEGLAVGPDGSLYLADNNRIRRVAPPLPGFAATDVVAASEDGSQLYVFDGTGRHLRTLDALTNAVLFEFGYDARGRLSQVIQKTGATDNVTTIEHDAGGNPTAIVAPFGQRTTLAVDANGFLASIRNPAGEQIQLASTTGGLLTSLADPRGKTSTFSYDSDGRLTRDADPAGGVQVLARTVGADQFSVARTTALARNTTYKVEDLPNAIQKRTVTAPDATQVVSQETIDAGATTTTSPDGTVTVLQLGPDPRFEMQSPVATSLSVALPGGPTLTVATTRTAVLTNPLDPLSLSTLTGTSTVDGRTTTSTYSAATKTEVTTTGAGRSSTLTIDSLGRPIQSQTGGLAPATFTYDSRGRLASMTQGSGVSARTYSFAYNAQGFLGNITDPIGRNVQFTHDPAGRVISKTLPDGRVVGFGYDASGNVTSLTPPGRPAHAFIYSDRDEVTLSTPPAVAGTGPSSFSYNPDRQYVTTARPDNRSVTLGYDAAGRPTTRTLATPGVLPATDTLSYDGAGRIASVAAGSGVTTAYTYAGSLLTGESWAGTTAGSVTRAYDASLRLSSQSVNGANPIAFGYDNDSLIVSAGALTITRDSQHGLATGSTLGVVNTTTGYNAFGESTSYATSAGGVGLYNVTFVRDRLGRIIQKTETVGGVTDTFVYTYDSVGQITLVTKNGAAVEAYGYDTNGNRISATVAGSSVSASYDNQDRLASYGTTSFAYTAAGELLSKTAGGQTTTYQYDAAGNLTGVSLPSGTSIGYVVDGRDRRVGIRVNGALVRGLLYSDNLRPVAELSGTGTLVSRFVYAGRHVPAYVIKGGVAHRIITDQVGSVRLVVNATTGTIAQRIDYDTFGNVIADSNPGFQPFGFAGGIYEVQTGLIRFGARDYDATIGRWTAKDPIGFTGNDTNLYRYVRNDPVNFIDPSGRNSVVDGLLGIAAGLFDLITLGATSAIPAPPEGSLARATYVTGNPITDTINLINGFSDEPLVDTSGFGFNAGRICTGFIGGGAGSAVGRTALAAEASLAAAQARNAARLAAARSGQVDFEALRLAATEGRAAAAAEAMARSAAQAVRDAARQALDDLGKMSSTGWKGGGGGSGVGSGGAGI